MLLLTLEDFSCGGAPRAVQKCQGSGDAHMYVCVYKMKCICADARAKNCVGAKMNLSADNYA